MEMTIKQIEEIYLQTLLTYKNNIYTRANDPVRAPAYKEGVIALGMHNILMLKAYIDADQLYQVKDHVLYYRGIAAPIEYNDYGMTDVVHFNGQEWCSNNYDDMTDWLDHQILERDLALNNQDFQKRLDELQNFLLK